MTRHKAKLPPKGAACRGKSRRERHREAQRRYRARNRAAINARERERVAREKVAMVRKAAEALGLIPRPDTSTGFPVNNWGTATAGVDWSLPVQRKPASSAAWRLPKADTRAACIERGRWNARAKWIDRRAVLVARIARARFFREYGQAEQPAAAD